MKLLMRMNICQDYECCMPMNMPSSTEDSKAAPMKMKGEACFVDGESLTSAMGYKGNIEISLNEDEIAKVTGICQEALVRVASEIKKQ